MKSDQQRAAFLERLRASNPIAELIREGVTPEEIHVLVLRTLLPHFTNRNVVELYALSVLVPQAINVLRIQKNPAASAVFRRCIEIHHQAHSVDRTGSLRASAAFWSDTTAGVSELWSAGNLERDKSDLPIHEFKTEVFRLIGMVLEASLQPFLRELVVQVRISKGTQWDAKEVRQLSLGYLVAELSASARLPDLVAPRPWCVRLNQWRNVAQHHLARVEGEEIVLSTAATKTQTELRLSRTEALDVCRQMISLFTAVKSANDIVNLDRTGAGPCFHDEHGIREEAVLLHFSSAFSTQGFELLDLVISEVDVRADLGDIMGGDEVQRVAHASQLLQLLFGFIPRSSIQIRYFDVQRQLRATATADGLLVGETPSRSTLTPRDLAAKVVVRFCSEEVLRSQPQEPGEPGP